MIDKNEEWISSMQLATLVSDTDLRAAISKLTLATGDLGEAQKLAALAADVAAATGKNYAAVATAMAKAADGNTAAIARLVPGLDAGADGVLTLKEVTDQLGKSFEGAAEKAAANDPWKRFKTIVDELKEAIGAGLVPMLDAMSSWFSKKENRQKVLDMVDAVAQFSTETGKKAVQAIKDFIAWLKSPEGKQAMKNFKEDSAQIADAVKAISDSIIVVIGWIKDLISWYNRIPAPLKRGAGGGAALGPILGLGRSAAPTASTTAAASTAAASDMNIVVHVDQWGSARVTKRALEANDRRQGRRPGTPLRVAW
jgi:hypothetical protein